MVNRIVTRLVRRTLELFSSNTPSLNAPSPKPCTSLYPPGHGSGGPVGLSLFLSLNLSEPLPEAAAHLQLEEDLPLSPATPAQPNAQLDVEPLPEATTHLQLEEDLPLSPAQPCPGYTDAHLDVEHDENLPKLLSAERPIEDDRSPELLQKDVEHDDNLPKLLSAERPIEEDRSPELQHKDFEHEENLPKLLPAERPIEEDRSPELLQKDVEHDDNLPKLLPAERPIEVNRSPEKQQDENLLTPDMALTSPAPPDAQVVGNIFVQQYYTVLLACPEHIFRFYNESSIVSRPDSSGEMIVVTTIKAISDLLLHYYTGYNITAATVDSQLTINEGVLVVVTGTLTGLYTAERKFCHSFLLTYHGTGIYYVLNDILRFTDETRPMLLTQQLQNGSTGDVSQDPLVPHLVSQEVPCVQDCELRDSGTPPSEGLRESGEENECISENEDDVSQDPDVPDHHDSPDVPCVQDCELRDSGTSSVVENDCISENGDDVGVEERSPNTRSGPPVTEVTHLLDQKDPPKESYESIVNVQGSTMLEKNCATGTKARLSSSIPEKPVTGPTIVALRKVAPSTEASATGSTSVTKKDDSPDGLGYSIYVKNLPITATAEQVEIEFSRFGSITSGGVQVKRQKAGRNCFGFVEFESNESMRNAIMASPVVFEGRPAFVEEKRTTIRVKNGVIVSGLSARDHIQNYQPRNFLNYQRQNFHNGVGQSHNFQNGDGNSTFGRCGYRKQGNNSPHDRVQSYRPPNFQTGINQPHVFQNGYERVGLRLGPSRSDHRI